MSRKTPRVISDKQWQKMAPLFPQHPPSPKGGRPRIDDRECLEGLLWLLHSGGRWRDIPRDLPSGSTCWRRLHEWAEAGVLEKIQAVLVAERPNWAAWTSASCSPMRHSCGRKKGRRGG
jgi:transposase